MSFNPITKAVADVRRSIPKEIVNAVFLPKFTQWQSQVVTVEEEIVRRVIRPMVLVDCNLIGGKEVFIRTDNCRKEQTPEQYVVLFIPKELTQNRSIVQPLHLSYMAFPASDNFGAASQYAPCSISPVLQAAAAVGASFGTSGSPGTTRLELIGENVILVKEPGMYFGSGQLRCIVENDSNMSNLHSRSYFAFSRLCSLAVKAYIYNEIIIDVDEGRIKGGFEIGVFRSILEGYSDAMEEYIEYRDTTWIKVAQMNDPETYSRFARMIIRPFP